MEISNQRESKQQLFFRGEGETTINRIWVTRFSQQAFNKVENENNENCFSTNLEDF